MSTLKVDTILKRSGTGTITLGQSGDTLTIPTGASLSLPGGSNGQALTTDGSGTLSFSTVGGVMTPAFEAYKASSSNVSDNTAEKIANVGQIIGAGLDVVGTIAPPLALLGGAVDILSGIIGGAGNIAEGEKAEETLDKQEELQKQKKMEKSVVGAQQITTTRTM